MHLADAELLESTFLELRAKHDGAIAIDLAGTNFLDSDSASILCRLKRRRRISRRPATEPERSEEIRLKAS